MTFIPQETIMDDFRNLMKVATRNVWEGTIANGKITHDEFE